MAKLINDRDQQQISNLSARPLHHVSFNHDQEQKTQSNVSINVNGIPIESGQG